jgi:hypothetical protein
MYHIVYDEKKNLVTVAFHGNTTIKDIIDFYHEIIANESYPNRIKLLSDFTKAMTNEYDKDDIKQLIHHANEYLAKRFEHIKWANLSLSPIHTTGATLFAAAIDTNRFNYAYFTTRNKAIEFLLD